jgi:hypothetical protein
VRLVAAVDLVGVGRFRSSIEITPSCWTPAVSLRPGDAEVGDRIGAERAVELGSPTPTRPSSWTRRPA